MYLSPRTIIQYGIKSLNSTLAFPIPCLCSVVIALGLAKVSCRVPGPEAVAIAVEVCYQNTGLAMAIALSSFEEDDASKAAGVPLFYAALQVLVLPIFLLLAWKLDMTYAKRNEPLWRVIFISHQPKGSTEEASVIPAPSSVCSRSSKNSEEVQAANDVKEVDLEQGKGKQEEGPVKE